MTVSAEPIEVPSGIVHETTKPRITNPQVRDLWVAGLRSGAYKEGSWYLRTTNDEYDPFGVLCDIGVQLGVASWDHNKGDGYYHIYGNSTHVPYPIREWAGFKGMHASQDVPLVWEMDIHPLWRLVDRYKLDHSVIADMIEEQY